MSIGNKIPLIQLLQYVTRRRHSRVAGHVHTNLGGIRCFIRGTSAGKVRDLTPLRSLPEALRLPSPAFLGWTLHIGLGKTGDPPPRCLTVGLLGSSGGDQHIHLFGREQFGQEGDSVVEPIALLK